MVKDVKRFTKFFHHHNQTRPQIRGGATGTFGGWKAHTVSWHGARGRGRDVCTDQLIAGQGAGPDGRTDPIHVLRCDAGRARARPSSAFHAPWAQVYHHHTRTPSATLLLCAMRARSWVGAVRKKIARRKIITTVLSSTYYYSSNFLERCR